MFGNAKVYVYPYELWNYILSNMDLLKQNDVIIAEDPGILVEVIVSADAAGNVSLSVCIDGHEESSEELVDREDAQSVCRKVYEEWFVEKDDTKEDQPKSTAPADDAKQEDDRLDKIIDTQESILLSEFHNFLDVVTDYGDVAMDDETEFNLLDEVLMLLSENGIPVFRPCFMPDGSGGEVFTEYPYELALEDTGD